MEDVNYDGLLGMMSENNKKQDAIQAICKAIEKQQISQSVLKEENQTKILTVAINVLIKK